MEPIAESLWIVERPMRFLGVEVGTRMTVLRLADGSLLIHSPVAPDPGLVAEVRALGPVRALLAASKFHHLFVAPWLAACPDARAYACPGLAAKRTDIAWHGLLGDAAPPEWAAEVEQVHFAARTLEDEVVFHHRPSGTFLCSDAVFHLSRHPSWVTRATAFALGNTRPGATHLEPLMMRDRVAARAQVDRMLAWRPERLVLAHGPWLPTGATEVLEAAYAWL